MRMNSKSTILLTHVVFTFFAYVIPEPDLSNFPLIVAIDLGDQNGVQVFKRHIITSRATQYNTETRRCLFYKNTVDGYHHFYLIYVNNIQWQIFENLEKHVYDGCPDTTDEYKRLFYHYKNGVDLVSEGWTTKWLNLDAARIGVYKQMQLQPRS